VTFDAQAATAATGYLCASVPWDTLMTRWNDRSGAKVKEDAYLSAADQWRRAGLLLAASRGTVTGPA
jgi:hypothetical protein